MEQAHEPTMEEILASIRRIISDDDQPSEQDEAVPEAVEEELAAEIVEEQPDADEPAAEDDGIDVEFADIAEDEDEGEDVFELTEVVEEEETPAEVDEFDTLDAGDISFEDIDTNEESVDLPDDNGADVAFVDMDEPEADVMEEVAAEPAEPAEDPLLSQSTDATVAAAFGQLASTLLTRDGTTRTLEELVQEMLRPMLKAWLDENLPGVVEELVRQEIERVARRGGR